MIQKAWCLRPNGPNRIIGEIFVTGGKNRNFVRRAFAIATYVLGGSPIVPRWFDLRSKKAPASDAEAKGQSYRAAAAAATRATTLRLSCREP
jgi:hypothetical protein